MLLLVIIRGRVDRKKGVGQNNGYVISVNGQICEKLFYVAKYKETYKEVIANIQ